MSKLICANPNDPLYKKLVEAIGRVPASSFFNRSNGDIDFINGWTKQQIIDHSQQISHAPTHSAPLVGLRVLLKERLNKLRNSKAKNVAFKENQIKRQLEKLKGVDEIIGIAQVIDYLYDEAIGEKNEDGSITGIAATMDKALADIKDALSRLQTLDGKAQKKALRDITARLQEYHDYAESLDHLDQYAKLYDKTIAGGTVAEPGSTLDKINQLSTLRKRIKDNYMEVVLPVVAKNLYAMHNKSTNESIEADYQAAMARAFEKQSQGKDATEDIKRAEKRYSDNYVTEEAILKKLKEVNKDIPYLDKMFSPMINLGDFTLSLFAKFVKKDFFDVKQQLQSWKMDVTKEYEKFIKATGKGRDRVNEVNKDITEIISKWVFNEESQEWEETRHNALVQEVDMTAYNKLYKETYIKANEHAKSSKQYKAIWGAFYKEAKEKLHKDDRVEYGRTIKGVASLVKDKRDELAKGRISQEQFDDWVIYNMTDSKTFKRNSVKGVVINKKEYAAALMDIYADGDGYAKLQYRGDMSVVKKSRFVNQKFAKLSGPAKEYHSFMVEKYMQSQKRLPDGRQLGYILPYKYKTEQELLIEGNVRKAGKQFVKNAVSIRKDDTEFGDPNADKVNPIYFTNYIPAEDSSLDVFESIVTFEKMSAIYESVGRIEPTANAFKTLIGERDTLEADGKGNNALSKAAKALGVEDFSKVKGVTNAAEMVEWFIEQQLYHEFNLKEMISTPWGDLNAGKLISSVMSAASLSMLGGPELLKSMANTVQAKIQKNIEAFSKQFFNHKNLMYGQGQTALHMKNILSDFASPISTSLEGQLLDMVDFIQGAFMDEFGNNISGSVLKKLATSGTWMFMNNASEFETAAEMAFALMDTVKLIHNGQKINLKEAWELGSDGKIKLKDGVTKEDGSEWTQDDLFEFSNQLHAINKGLNGVYNNFDRALSKRWSLMRLVQMFKGFLTTTTKKRFKSYGGDHELGSSTEGFYRTFYRMLWSDRDNMIKFLMKKEHNLSPTEAANIRRAIAELSLVILLTTAAMFVKDLGDDDEELKKNWAYQFALYELTRAASELRFYQPGFGAKDQLKLFTSPSAMNAVVERSYKAIAQTVGYSADEGWAFNDTYKVKSGWNEKGDSKLVAGYAALLGFNGNNLTPSQATEIFHKL